MATSSGPNMPAYVRSDPRQPILVNKQLMARLGVPITMLSFNVSKTWGPRYFGLTSFAQRGCGKQVIITDHERLGPLADSTTGTCMFFEDMKVEKLSLDIQERGSEF